MASVTEQGGAGAVSRARAGSRPPRITVRDSQGRALDMAGLAGRPTLVNLWATWCAPCIAELPQLDRLAAEGRFRVVTVSQDLAGGTDIAAFLRQRGRRLEPWLDPDNALSDHYGAGALPTSVIYGADGREVWRVAGPLDWESAQARALLAEVR